MRRFVGQAVAAALLGSSLVACGASRSSHPFTIREVRHAFAVQQLRPNIDFDASTATDGDIARLAKDLTPHGGAGMQQLLVAQAAGYKQMRAQGISLLTFHSGSSEDDIDVAVAPDAAHAARIVANIRLSRKRAHANVRIVVKRRGNVVVFFPVRVGPRVKLAVNRAFEAI